LAAVQGLKFGGDNFHRQILLSAMVKERVRLLVGQLLIGLPVERETKQ